MSHKFTLFSSTISTMQRQQTQEASISSPLTRGGGGGGGAKVKNQKDLIKEKDRRGPQVAFLGKESQKAKERPSQKAKVNGPHGHGIRITIGISVIKKATNEGTDKERSFVRFAAHQVIGHISVDGINTSALVESVIDTKPSDKYITAVKSESEL